MKKFILILGLLAFALSGFSQVGKERVPDRVTEFGKNLPAGTTIECISDTTSWTVGAEGVEDDRTINTAWAAGEIKWNRPTLDIVVAEQYNNLIIDSLRASKQVVKIDSANTDRAGLLTKWDYIKLDGITAGSGVAHVDYFEVAASGDDKTETLDFSPLDSTSVIVSVNGTELSMVTPYDQWDINLGTKVVTFRVYVYIYDRVMISYSK